MESTATLAEGLKPECVSSILRPAIPEPTSGTETERIAKTLDAACQVPAPSLQTGAMANAQDIPTGVSVEDKGETAEVRVFARRRMYDI